MIGDANTKKFFYHTDQVGSVRAVTNDTGQVVWKSDYLAFGTQFGKDKLDPSFEEDEFAFTGKGFDGDTGLYYYNARWYDFETGRFMSEDPVGDPNNPNLYSYCRNNPLRFTDPTGLISQQDAMSQHQSKSSNAPSYDWSGNYSYSGGSKSPPQTVKFDRDGNLKSISFRDNNGLMTNHYNPDGSLNYTGTMDYNSGISTLTYYHDDGSESTTTFGPTGEMTGYSRKAPSIVVDLSNLQWVDEYSNLLNDDRTQVTLISYYFCRVPEEYQFDPNNIVRVEIINVSAVPGHNAVILIDSHGCYYPAFEDQRAVWGVPGDMRYRALNPDEVERALYGDGKIISPSSTWWGTIDYEQYDQHFGINISTKSGLAMYNKAEAIRNYPGTYYFFAHNCSHVAGDIVRAGGVKFDNSYIPDIAYYSTILENSLSF